MEEQPTIKTESKNATAIKNGVRYDERMFRNWAKIHRITRTMCMTRQFGKRGVQFVSVQYAMEHEQTVWMPLNLTRGNPFYAEVKDVKRVYQFFIDGEDVRNPEGAYQFGHLVCKHLISVGIARPDQPVERSGAGFHIIIAVPPIDTDEVYAQKIDSAWKTLIRLHTSTHLLE